MKPRKTTDLMPPGNHIAGMFDSRRMPRLGKVRLGHLVPNASGNGQHPEELPYFRFDDETLERWPTIRELYGDEPTRLDVCFPAEDNHANFGQNYKLYGHSGLKCRGDGSTAYRRYCSKCHEMSCQCHAPTQYEIVPCPCDLLDPDLTPNANNRCSLVGTIRFFLYKITMAGVFEITTGSKNSVVDVLSGMDMARAIVGRLANVPAVLERKPMTVHPNGRTATKHTLSLLLPDELAQVERMLNEPTARALFALPPSRDEAQDYQELTGRALPPPANYDAETGEVFEPEPPPRSVNAEPVDDMPPENTREPDAPGRAAACATQGEEPGPPPSAGEPACPKCGGEMWDNRDRREQAQAEIAAGTRTAKAPPAWKCKDKECGGVLWPSDPDENKSPTAPAANDEPQAPAPPAEPSARPTPAPSAMQQLKVDINRQMIAEQIPAAQRGEKLTVVLDAHYLKNTLEELTSGQRDGLAQLVSDKAVTWTTGAVEDIPF